MSIAGRIKSHASTLVLGALLLGVAGYEIHQMRQGRVVPSAQAKPAAPIVRSVMAEGRLAVPQGAEITVGAELDGKLVRLLVKEQDRVKAGDVLGEVDVTEQQAALGEAWARVKEAGADVEFAQRERRRAEQLWNSNVVAEAALDRSVHEASAAERRRGSLVAAAARISAQLAKAKVIAPIDGVVTQRFADAGEMLAAGSPILTITDLRQVRVEAEVGEFDTARVHVGDVAEIRAEGYEQRWRGKVTEIPERVGPRSLKPLDPSRPVDTRVLLVKIALDGTLPLKLGQRVEIELRP